MQVVHRVGEITPEEPIVQVAVSSRHRGEAFRACEFIIDYLKTRAPFWKKETTAEGERWVDARTATRSQRPAGTATEMRPLTPEEKARYSRQTRVPGFGEATQARLLAARVLIVGMGGLGSPAALYLAASGIGTLVLCDFDRVETSNLQRQIIHRHASIGEPKALSAAATLKEINPDCGILALDYALEEPEMRRQVELADLVLDCTDNFETRFLLNRLCFDTGTPLVSGAAIRTDGQIISFIPAEPASPCYRCLHPQASLEQVETCALEGILAPVVGVIGTLQAQQALLVLAGEYEPLVGTLLLFDGRGMEWHRVQVPRSPTCPVCSGRPGLPSGQD